MNSFKPTAIIFCILPSVHFNFDLGNKCDEQIVSFQKLQHS